MGVLRMFQGCFKEVSRAFQGSFKGVSKKLKKVDLRVRFLLFKIAFILVFSCDE